MAEVSKVFFSEVRKVLPAAETRIYEDPVFCSRGPVGRQGQGREGVG